MKSVNLLLLGLILVTAPAAMGEDARQADKRAAWEKLPEAEKKRVDRKSVV